MAGIWSHTIKVQEKKGGFLSEEKENGRKATKTTESRTDRLEDQNGRRRTGQIYPINYSGF